MLSKEDLRQALKEIGLDEEKKRTLYEVLTERIFHNPYPVQSNAGLLIDALTDNNAGEMLVALSGIGLETLLIEAKLVPNASAENKPTVSGQFYRESNGVVVFRSRCAINPHTFEIVFAPEDAERFPQKRVFDKEYVCFQPFLSTKYKVMPETELCGRRTVYWYKNIK